MTKKLLKLWLRYLAALVLRKYHPRIVAITGSTGKTSTREAILTVLKNHSENPDIVGTIGNLNTELGVTATIISPGFIGTQVGVKTKLTIRDVWYLTWHALNLSIRRVAYPKILVLELAADRPGDIEYFMSFIKPEVGVLTNIGDAHLEFFYSKAQLVEEKSLVITHVDSRGTVILNQDDDFSKLISRKTAAKKIMVSAEEKSDWWASDIGFSSGGIRFNAMSNKSKQGMTPISLPVYGYQFVYAALMALAVGDYFRVPLETMAHRLSKYQLPDRRFEIIKLGGNIVIDDTYNANPASMLAALKSLARLGVNRRKIAILGDMKELGSAHIKGHQSVGECAAKVVDQLWVVGEGGNLIKEAAVRAGLPLGQARNWSESAIPTVLQDNNIVLVKGSQAVRMDQIVTLIKEFYERSH
ncbi:MAG: Mur ligase family protein [Patescibacteria group bacterium]|jgi:UDP-N-acetylmuramoyl-tripeptide--D-alanyl-D-alanine ligase